MRNWQFPLSCAIVIAALGMWPGSSGAIVCPAEPGIVVPPLCCGPAMSAADVPSPCCQAVCCTSACCMTACCGASDVQPACTAERLTIFSSPNPSTEGRKVTISGTLTNGPAQAAVYLWQKLPGQGTFTRVAQTTTNAAGGYTFVRGDRVLKTNASWYTTAAGASSTTLVQGVHAKVTFGSVNISGTLVTLTGHVSPSHWGERIWLERYSAAKHWRTVTSSAIGRWSDFTVRHRFAHSGNVLLRAVFGGDARNLRSKSAPLRIALT